MIEIMIALVFGIIIGREWRSAKTMSQRETEAFLAMAKRLEQLEALVPKLKNRIADLEDLLTNK